ncbi:hypothetical protein JCGZ_15838 [Jatropha curcas]|uniref:RING-type E3 ubiquitin transferase n=1 Tax=Jatropha curcas TaxID=180498 RepID=A0A067KZ02_JATCU|nr:RING-H2 finger protein ATL54 [Jatropha curcas]XP_037494936.1 RING-H2 finger protein ATL54-like [Jatropha curcas]KDP41431.1 hypothetical protein JCGZ_15838 [Jatropha curcas]
MAMKHRKLFPALTATNQTTDCPDFCDPACPYNCYPYADYYFLPPPPPPPPSTLIPPEHRISPYVIVIVSLLASFFLFVSYYVIIAKSCPSWFFSRNNQNPGAEEDDNIDEELLDENQIDHPIWFITTSGLQQSIINSITVCKYKKGEGLIEGTECSVCLSEFQQDETLRLLPKCSHAFHISCIDTWLRSHTNCPLCRAHIVNDSVITPLVSVNQNSDNSNQTVSIQMDDTEIEGELGNIQERNEVCEIREETEEGTEGVNVGNGRTLKEDSICGIQPMRRSASMDSFEGGTICAVELQESSVNEIEKTEHSCSHPGIVSNRHGGSSIAQYLHKGPVPMKRSFSCGGRFFSSRQIRNLNSILPL